MSYLKLEIGGKERGLKFNQMAFIIMSQKIDKDNQIATAAYALVYAGLKANCYVKSEEADFTFEDVCDWVDDMDDQTILKIQAAFQETQAYKDSIQKEEVKPEEEETEEDAKKKQNGTLIPA